MDIDFTAVEHEKVILRYNLVSYHQAALIHLKNRV
jgi:hypothetical protein